MKNKPPKVRYRRSKRISKEEAEEKLNKAFDLLFEEVWKKEHEEKLLVRIHT